MWLTPPTDGFPKRCILGPHSVNLGSDQVWQRWCLWLMRPGHKKDTASAFPFSRSSVFLSGHLLMEPSHQLWGRQGHMEKPQDGVLSPGLWVSQLLRERFRHHEQKQAISLLCPVCYLSTETLRDNNYYCLKSQSFGGKFLCSDR